MSQQGDDERDKSLLGEHEVVFDWEIGGAFLVHEGAPLLGRRPEDYQPSIEWWSSQMHPDEREAVTARMRALVSGESESYCGEFRMHRADGKWASLSMVAVLVRDPDGTPRRVIGVAANMTARRRMEEEMRASRELLGATLEHVDDIIWSFGSNQTLLYLSAATERIFGRPMADILTDWTTWIDAVHPDDREHVLRESMAAVLAGEGRQVFRIVRPNGEVRWLSDRLRVTRKADGGLDRIDGIATDITDNVMAERQLAAEKDTFEQIVRGAPLIEVLAVLCRSIEERAEGCFASVRVLDPASGRLVDSAAPSLSEPRRRAIDALMQSAMGGGSGAATVGGDPFYFEDLTTHPSGSEGDPALAAAGIRAAWSQPIRDGEGHMLGAFAIYWQRPRRAEPADQALLERMATVAGIAISRKRIEAQLLTANRLASVGTLAAGVAHEINNPLAFILGNVSFLRARLGELVSAPGGAAFVREMDEALADCAEGARRIGSIVRDLRSFSRSGEEQPGPVDLGRVLEFAVRMVFNEVRHRARLVRAFDDAPIALGDEGRLVQVIVNLLVNAAQAMPERSSEESEVVLAARIDGGRAIVEVRDNGVGIEPEMQARIFDPFFTTRPVGQGTGLGLAISHGLIASMRGSLTVESKPGAGSCFRISLPLASAEPKSEGETASAAPPAAARRLRLLVIDDETLVGASIRRLVGQRYDVVHVEDARAALSLLQRESFDAVLCDLMMPLLTGMELHAELERLRPELARRTGFITGGAFSERAREFAGAHAARCLEKPFNAEAVQMLVERLVA